MISPEEIVRHVLGGIVRRQFAALLDGHTALDEAAIASNIIRHPWLASSKFPLVNAGHCYPLLHLLYKRASLNLVKFVHKAFPEAAISQNGFGHTALHIVLQRGSINEDVVRYLLSVAPQNMAKKSGLGFTPLGISCHLGLGCNMVRLLVDADPPSAADRHRGLTMLHLTCMAANKLDPETIRYLALEYPTALNMPDDIAGDLPIHTLLKRHCDIPLDLLELLIKSSPRSLVTKNREGCTPLHVICAKWARLEAVRLIHEANPAALSTMTSVPPYTDATPLHVAWAGFSTLSSGFGVLEYLTRHFPCEEFRAPESFTPCPDRLVQAFAKSLSRNEQIRSINLSTVSLELPGFLDLVGAIQTNQRIERLALNVIITHRMTHHIERDDLCSKKFNEVRDLNQALERLLESNHTLQSLSIVGRPLPSQWLWALSKNNTLKVLDLGNCHMGPFLVKSLSCVLPVNSTLSQLLIQGNNLSEQDMVGLINSLEANRGIELLDFGGEEVSNRVLQTMLDVIERSNCTLCTFRRNLPVREGVQARLLEQIDYYGELNGAGRRITRDPSTTKQRLVEVLGGCHERVHLCYGLLRETPHLWSG